MSEEKPPEKISMLDIRKLVSDTIDSAMEKVTKSDPDPKQGDKSDPPVDGRNIADRVRAEIEKIRSSEKAEAEKADMKDQLKKLSEATQERPPVERGRLHRFMGWGE